MGELPTIAQWERERSDEATPRCPDCDRLLGIRRGLFPEHGRDAWFCDECDKEFPG